MGVLCDQLPDEFDTGEFLSGNFIEIPNDFMYLQENSRSKLVGVERLPTTPKSERILDHPLVGITTIVVIHAQPH